jgi:hypothetical protein
MRRLSTFVHFVLSPFLLTPYKRGEWSLSPRRGPRPQRRSGLYVSSVARREWRGCQSDRGEHMQISPSVNRERAQVDCFFDMLFFLHAFQVLLAGITGALAGAISMALGEYMGMCNCVLLCVDLVFNFALQQPRANEK